MLNFVSDQLRTFAVAGGNSGRGGGCKTSGHVWGIWTGEKYMQVEQTVNVQYSMPALVNLKVVGNGFGCPCWWSIRSRVQSSGPQIGSRW